MTQKEMSAEMDRGDYLRTIFSLARKGKGKDIPEVLKNLMEATRRRFIKFKEPQRREDLSTLPKWNPLIYLSFDAEKEEEKWGMIRLLLVEAILSASREDRQEGERNCTEWFSFIAGALEKRMDIIEALKREEKAIEEMSEGELEIKFSKGGIKAIIGGSLGKSYPLIPTKEGFVLQIKGVKELSSLVAELRVLLTFFPHTWGVRIIEGRNIAGAVKSISTLREVSGLGETIGRRLEIEGGYTNLLYPVISKDRIGVKGSFTSYFSEEELRKIERGSGVEALVLLGPGFWKRYLISMENGILTAREIGWIVEIEERKAEISLEMAMVGKLEEVLWGEKRKD